MLLAVAVVVAAAALGAVGRPAIELEEEDLRRGVRRFCRVGNASVPAEVFEAFAGWDCYEATFRGEKRLAVHVCMERVGDRDYSVPCFQSGAEMLTFNLKHPESVREIQNRYDSTELNDEMIRCYLRVVAACETSSDGWFGSGSVPELPLPWCRFFIGNGTRDACLLDGQSKFHIAMLSVSLIVGIPVALLFAYCVRVTQNVALSHCRNLIAVLVLRTFFTLLIETEVVSKMVESPEEPIESWAGCEALASFEAITLNLVVAFWLILAFYLLEYSKSDFEKEPEIRMGIYIVTGLAVGLGLIWTIVMAAGEEGNCWLLRTPLQWVNDALRLGFLLVQIFLISIVVFRAMTNLRDVDGSQANLLRKMSLLTMALCPAFLLQFSLVAAHPEEVEAGEAHIYTEYFFDGCQLAFVSVIYLFLPEVFQFILDLTGFQRRKKCHRVFETVNPEVELRLPSRPPLTSAESSPTVSEGEVQRDVIYTSVLTPERFERTIRLYNRINAIPKVEKEVDTASVKSEYFDVDLDSVKTSYDDVEGSPVASPVKAEEGVAGGAPTRPSPGRGLYSSRYLLEDTESSAESEESVIEVKPREAPKEEAIPELPLRERDREKAIEDWLRNSRAEFEDYAEKAAKRKNAVESRNTVRRTLSGFILTGDDVPGSVRVELKDGKVGLTTRKGSAPSLVALAETKSDAEREEPRKSAFSTPPDSLPSIYDDLKNLPRTKKPRVTRMKNKRAYNASWSNYRNRLLEDKKRARSSDDLEREEKPQMSPQLNALLSPRYEAEDPMRNLFFGCNGSAEVAKPRDEPSGVVEDEWAPQRMHFVDVRQN